MCAASRRSGRQLSQFQGVPHLVGLLHDLVPLVMVGEDQHPPAQPLPDGAQPFPQDGGIQLLVFGGQGGFLAQGAPSSRIPAGDRGASAVT